MPLDAPQSLSAADYRAVTDYLLASNGQDHKAAPGVPVEAKADEASPLKLPGLPQIFGKPSTAGPTDAELLHPGDDAWPMYNRDYQGQRFSPLTQITPNNVASLAPKCIFQAGEVAGFQTSPIVYREVLYFTTAHMTYAVGAATCRKIWSYRYEPIGAELLPNNRGAVLYRGMVVRGTLDGHLIALDAATGKLLWDEWVCDSKRGCVLSGAPVAFNNKIFVGEAGGDYGSRGHIHAFDAMTGTPVWTFDTVPTGKEPGAETWGKGENPGGGAAWTTITIDPATKLVFVSVGNPGFDYDGRARPGTNLYTDSVVALSADNGHLAWYVQQNPHDTHDWDTAAAPTLYNQGGRNFLAVGSKDSRLYIYDRDSHALIARKNLQLRVNDTAVPQPGVPIHSCPGTMGGVEWNGPAFDPATGSVFVNSVDWCSTFTLERRIGEAELGAAALAFDPIEGARGWLRAFDAETGSERWAYSANSPMLAAVTPTTSGLVMTGSGSGDFLVFDATTGRQLYSFYTGGAMAGGVSTYLSGGKQYVAVASGSSSKALWQTTGAATLIVFGLMGQ
jgi:PQQ-dependent dehydrogenase (methanol/ethanol family)